MLLVTVDDDVTNQTFEHNSPSTVRILSDFSEIEKAYPLPLLRRSRSILILILIAMYDVLSIFQVTLELKSKMTAEKGFNWKGCSRGWRRKRGTGEK